MKPLVSIIVPTFNNAGTIGLCLRSLQKLEYWHFEVNVVNDGSTDGTLEVARQSVAGDERFRFFSLDRQTGPGAARNVGMLHARGAILAFIDGDISAPPDWLDRLLPPLLEGQADCSGGPDYVPHDGPLLSRCIGYSMDSIVCTGGLRLGRTRLVKYLPGTGNMAVWKDVLERVGPFDEHFRDTGEDKELLYRVQCSGARIQYVHDAPVWHHRAPDFYTHARKMFLYGVRRVDIWRRQQGTLELAHFVPALLTLSMLLCIALAGVWPLARNVCLLALAALLTESVAGAFTLRDARAFFVLPATSAVIPLGYGCGILLRLLQPLAGRRP
jgi:glycosyltransferase involved in cell wall biosynthesis